MTTDAIYGMEATLIATLLDGPPRFRKRILGRVRAEDFVSESGQEVFRRLLALIRHGKSLPSRDALRVDYALSEEARLFLKRGDVLKRSGDLELLLENFTRASRAEKALDDLNEAARLLKAREIEDAATLLSQLRTKLQVGEPDVLELDAAPENFARSLRTLDTVLKGEAIHLVPTGLEEFDRRSRGIPRGGITLIGANTGGGKSMLALNMALNQARLGYRVAYVSLEMGKEELLARLISRVARLPFESVYTGRVKKAARDLAIRKFGSLLRQIWAKGGTLHLYTPESDNVSMDDVCAWARGRNFDVIYVDYVGLLRDLSRQRAKWENLGDAVRNAKLFAGSLRNKPAMVILVQYDMKKDQVRYSRAMVEHASLCWVWTYSDVERSTHRIKVRQVKTRNQPQYDFWLRENFQFCEVVSVTKQEVDEALKEDTVDEAERRQPLPEEPQPPADLDAWVDQFVEEERREAIESARRQHRRRANGGPGGRAQPGVAGGARV